MKRKFIKGLSVATAICLAVSSPATAIAEEVKTNNNSTTISGTNSNDTNINGDQNLDTDDSSSNSLNDEEDDLPYEVSNSESGTELKNNTEINTDNRGIEVRKKSSVKQEGNISTKDDAVTVTGGSKVSVDGDITATDKKGNESSINGVQVLDGAAEINGNITIDTEGKIGSKSIGVYAGDSKKQTGDIDVIVNGNISATSKKTTDYHQPESMRDDGTYDEDLSEDSEGYGVRATSTESQTTFVTVNGNISSNATAIDEDDIGSVGLKIGSNRGETTVIVNGDVKSNQTGVSISNNRGLANVIIKGDVSAKCTGISIMNNTGDINIVVDGTVDASGNAIRNYNRAITEKIDGEKVNIAPSEMRGTASLIAWKLVTGDENLIEAIESGYLDDRGHVRGTRIHDDDDETKVDMIFNTNYIIRTKDVSNGTMKVSGTREVAGYNTALEADVITIKVDAASGYKLDAVKNGNSVLARNDDGTYTLVVPRGGGVELSAVITALKKMEDNSKNTSNNGSGSSHSSGSSGGFGGGSGSSPVVSNESQPAGTTVTSESGASVAKSVSAEGDSSTTTITIGDKTANISSITTDNYGLHTTYRAISGDIAGAIFKGVGTVSEDGKKVTTENGETYAVTNAPILIVASNEYKAGCFVDLNTGMPIATGETEVYYQLGEDGQLHAHWVDPEGFFYDGVRYVNGQYFEFSNEGVLLSIINIETDSETN